MTVPSQPAPPLSYLRAELSRYAYRLHHYERDHLEYGVPADRDTPIAQDPSGATLAELESVCTVLRSQIAVLDVADDERSDNTLIGRATSRRWRRNLARYLQTVSRTAPGWMQPKRRRPRVRR